MDQARLSDGKATYDDSFPIALNEELQKIQAVDAVKISNQSTFYCPKCYKLDPNNKTEVYPSNHETPRFNRCNGESHLEACQFKNAAQYLNTVSQKIQVNINGKEIQLSLMPYDGRGMNNKILGSKIKHYARPDNRKFMELVSEILTDYEMEYFHKKYNTYKIYCEGKSKSFRQLFTSIESAKANTYPYEEKLNIIVGEVECIKWNDQYILIEMDSSRSPFNLHLYLDRFLYNLDAFTELKGKRIACMGYIHKHTDNSYLMEIVSTSHQVAFLHDELSRSSLSPSIQTKGLDAFLEGLTVNFQKIQAEDFQHSYHQYKFDQLKISIDNEMEILKGSLNRCEKEKLDQREGLLKIEKDLTCARNDLKENVEERSNLENTLEGRKKELDTCRSIIDKWGRENKGLWNRLKNMLNGYTPEMIRTEIKANESKIQDHINYMEQKQKHLEYLNEKGSSLEQRLSTLQSNHSLIQDKINELRDKITELHQNDKNLKQQLSSALENAKKEKRIKDTIQLQGKELYELAINSNWSILFDIHIQYPNLSIECSILSFCVQKKEGFYIPYQYYHEYYRSESSYKRITQSNRHYTVRRMLEAVQGKINEDMKQLTFFINTKVDEN